jgi:putative transposase
VAQHLDRWPANAMCRVLGVSRSGFYSWLSRPPSPRDEANLKLAGLIEKIYVASRGTYGSPRVHEQLRGMGQDVGRGRVERLMRKHGIHSKTAKRFRVTTDSRHSYALSPNLVKRRFQVSAPNRVWASDVTYLWTREGWLYLAVTMDLFSRKIVGWSMSERLDGELAVRAFEAAAEGRRLAPGLIHHSDRGKEYASTAFRGLLARHGAVQSMSRHANCWDNAVVESFFHSLKVETKEDAVWPSRAVARQAVFDWIEVFYNRQRLHSTLGYQSPQEYETQSRSA